MFSEAELNALSKWAKSHGVLIIGLGDPLQNAAKVPYDRTLSNGTTRREYQNSGIEDCVYMGAPMLTASLRVINMAQKTNFENLYGRLYATYVESTKHAAWDLGQYDDSLNTQDLIIEFYESPEVIFGTKIVDNVDLIAEARKKKGANSVAIIYDDTTESKYKNLDEEGITLVPYNDMQGREFDYVFVDVDWNKHSRLSTTYVSKYNAMRDFYTVTQRARIGGIVIDNSIKALLNIQQTASNAERNQIFEIDENQKSRFKADRLNALSGLPEKEGFNDALTGITVTPKAKPTKAVEILAAPVATPKPEVKPTPKPAEAPVAPAPSSGMGTPTSEEIPAELPKPIPAQPIVAPTSTSLLADNKVFYQWFNNPEGFTKFEKANTHSIFNIAAKISPSFVMKNTEYRIMVNTIASYIRNNGDLVSAVHGILQPLVQQEQDELASVLEQYIKTTPEIRVNPLYSNISVVSARFYNGEDFITVPLMLVDGIKSGFYRGKIKRNRKAEKGTRGEHVSLARFIAENPGVILSNPAVLAMSEEKRTQIIQSSDYAESTKELLLERGNLGKIGIVFTDEPYIAANRFNGYLFTDENGFILKDYDDVGLMFTQKRASLTDVVSYAKSMAYIKNPERFTNRDRNRYTTENLYKNPKEVAFRVMGLNTDSIPEKGKDGKFKVITEQFQILDHKNIGNFLKAVLTLANTQPKYFDIYDRLFDFINTFKTKQDRGDYNIVEQNAIWAKVGDQSYLFEATVEDNTTKLLVSTYNPESGEIVQIDKLETIPHIKNLFERYFNQETPEIQLVYRLYGFDKNNVPTENRVDSYVDPNDQIYFTFKGITLEDDVNEIFKNLELDGRNPYKNGIYLNVRGTAAYGEDSVWMAANTTNDLLETDVNEIVYSVYSIDENEIVPYDEEPQLSEFDIFVKNIIKLLEANGISGITEDTLKAMETSDDILIQLNHQFEVEAFEKNNSPLRTVLGIGENGDVTISHVMDYENFITWHDNETNQATPIDVTAFDSHKFIIYQTENGDYKILREENGKWEAVSFASYSSYNGLLGLFAESNEFSQKIVPLKDYVYSLIRPYNAASDAVAERATEYMYNNIADPDIAAIYEQINNYLLERLENREC